jgi:pyruvate dehydrogenase E2 component (dihydrolipoamide acetyltransferase)
MSIQITMPALSPTMEEGTLAKWYVKPGDKIEPGQVIAEIETDKATMEVEAVDEGVVEELLVQAGAEGVKVNTPIARLSGEGEKPTPKQAPQADESKPAEPKAAPATATPAQTQKSKAKSDEHIAASPLARRLAEQAGIDLKGLKGSGPNGRIVKEDIEAASKQPQSASKAAPSADNRSLSLPQAVTSDTPSPRQLTLEEMGIAKGSYDLVPLDMMRKTIAKRLTEAARDIPHFPLTIDLEIDALLKARGDINKRFADNGVKISVNDIIIRACALALMRVPDSNASYTPQGIALHHHADIAVAVAIPGGLITPIIRNAEMKGLAQISHEMADLAARARNKKLRPEEYQGGTFSLSNLGMMGIKNFSSILNPPQGMIMSVGAGEKRPIVRNDALAIATIMSVTVTCDHRVVDGAIGAEFLKAFRGFIEDPMAMLL